MTPRPGSWPREATPLVAKVRPTNKQTNKQTNNQRTYVRTYVRACGRTYVRACVRACVTSRCVALRYVALFYSTWHDKPKQKITLHHITLTSHYIALHYIYTFIHTFHYISLHYIAYIHQSPIPTYITTWLATCRWPWCFGEPPIIVVHETNINPEKHTRLAHDNIGARIFWMKNGQSPNLKD